MLGTWELCCILDSMDAAKYCWPRSRVMSTKQFTKFHRPKMSLTALLCHGHLCLGVLTPHALTCNSSRTVEILSHGLTFLDRHPGWRFDLRTAVVHLQADNASKEVKNQSVCRHMAAAVALRKVKACQIAFLSSGHSHEDIDSMFSVVRSWIQRFPEIWTPTSFKDVLQSFFDKPEHRPYEKFRRVVMLTTFRDWTLSWYSTIIVLFPFSHIAGLGIAGLCWASHRTNQLSFHLRKIFWALHAQHAHIKGIGGPGAPHCFRFDRVDDLGS